ncbi:hypothetical protein [Halobacillus ihumii]|uniref:hypothetical protein n=1 Tax=Halobacillus ihumii TaxID=2686092 RepID=UPI0013D162CC|nr:hypothetical protein [Halobacillus ihumii]
MKNHIKVNGKLLQTNKRFSQLKERQKNWIPYGEVKKYVFRKTTKIVKSFEKQYPELSAEIEADHTEK